MTKVHQKPNMGSYPTLFLFHLIYIYTWTLAVYNYSTYSDHVFTSRGSNSLLHDIILKYIKEDQSASSRIRRSANSLSESSRRRKVDQSMSTRIRRGADSQLTKICCRIGCSLNFLRQFCWWIIWDLIYMHVWYVCVLSYLLRPIHLLDMSCHLILKLHGYIDMYMRLIKGVSRDPSLTIIGSVRFAVIS